MEMVLTLRKSGLYVKSDCRTVETFAYVASVKGSRRTDDSAWIVGLFRWCFGIWSRRESLPYLLRYQGLLAVIA